MNETEMKIKPEFTSQKITLINGLDELFCDAARIIVTHQQGSTSLIQRNFSIGYNRSGRIMDQLEATGIVGPSEGSKARQVLFIDLFSLENYLVKVSESKWDLDLSFRIESEYDEEKEREIEKENIRKEILEKERKRQLRKQIKLELTESGHISYTGKRMSIPTDVQDAVWNRDGGKCVQCGSKENLEFDHIIPFSKGGANTYRNLQLLCQSCNRTKSNNIG